jgi:hypothetical protein
VIHGIRDATLLIMLLTVPQALAQEVDCTTDTAGDPVCELRIQGGGEAASDLGVYNVALLLERLAPPPETTLSFSIAIDAAKCGEPPRRFIEEPAGFSGEASELKFNFPLLLHTSGDGGEYCVRVSAYGCEGGCTGQIELKVGDSAVMRQETDPLLR